MVKAARRWCALILTWLKGSFLRVPKSLKLRSEKIVSCHIFDAEVWNLRYNVF